MELDTSGHFPKKFGGSSYWLKIMDEYSSFFDELMKGKSDLPDKLGFLSIKLAIQDFNVKFLRCDNTGEHKRLVDIFLEHGIKL